MSPAFSSPPPDCKVSEVGAGWEEHSEPVAKVLDSWEARGSQPGAPSRSFTINSLLTPWAQFFLSPKSSLLPEQSCSPGLQAFAYAVPCLGWPPLLYPTTSRCSSRQPSRAGSTRPARGPAAGGSEGSLRLWGWLIFSKGFLPSKCFPSD